jgi:hypothetical protein
MISESYFYSHDVPIKVYILHLPADDSSVVSSSFSLALNSSPDLPICYKNKQIKI